ncbi:hypothetical protein OAI71_00840 [Marine Group III euryarchaeote]|nr:hypothetical protein [Marine Group III euryarchaeote]
MNVVLPDTNIILWTFSGGIDFREAIASVAPGYKILIPTCVLDELNKLKTKQSIAAIDFCKKMETIDVGRGYADDLLVKSAENGYLIATNDKEILNNLKEKGINALRPREKNKLIMTEKEL